MEWDKLFDQWVNCGENWWKSELVMTSENVREHARVGQWKLMSRTDRWLIVFFQYNEELLNIVVCVAHMLILLRCS